MNINQTIKQQLINGQISLKKIIDWISFTEKNNTIDTGQNYLLRLIQDLNNEKLEHKVKIIYDLEQFSQNIPNTIGKSWLFSLILCKIILVT